MLQPPPEMTPARAGFVLLGRPAPGQLVATTVDLALAGELRIRRRSGTWAVLPGERGARALSSYESALLCWLLPSDRPLLLAELDEARVAALDPVIDRLVAELRRHRLLRRRMPWPFRRDAERLTERGRALSGELARLRARLRISTLDAERMRSLFGYLVAFGLCTAPRMRAAPPALVRLAAFVADWHAACADLPGWRPPPPEKPEYDPMELHRPPLFTPGVPMGLGGLGT